MKKILMLAILMVGAPAYAGQYFQPDPIYAADKNVGSVTYHNKSQYMVSYRISISNPLKTAASLSKGCFVLFDRSGKEVVARGVDVNLLQEFAPGESKTGMVIFFGDNENLFNLKFVKWIDSNSPDEGNKGNSAKAPQVDSENKAS